MEEFPKAVVIIILQYNSVSNQNSVLNLRFIHLTYTMLTTYTMLLSADYILIKLKFFKKAMYIISKVLVFFWICH